MTPAHTLLWQHRQVFPVWIFYPRFTPGRNANFVVEWLSFWFFYDTARRLYPHTKNIWGSRWAIVTEKISISSSNLLLCQKTKLSNNGKNNRLCLLFFYFIIECTCIGKVRSGQNVSPIKARTQTIHQKYFTDTKLPAVMTNGSSVDALMSVRSRLHRTSLLKQTNYHLRK